LPMQITSLPATLLELPGGRTVSIATQLWALERWTGQGDPPDLKPQWSIKPGFAVRGRRSCAELAVLDHLRHDGWHGFWVNSFGRELRAEWFPGAAVRTIAETGAPSWVVETFERLLAANNGRLGGFFDVFAWRPPGEVRFDEVKVRPNRIGTSQCKFLKTALRFHPAEQFSLIEVEG
jgi:hypothetical protein